MADERSGADSEISAHQTAHHLIGKTIARAFDDGWIQFTDGSGLEACGDEDGHGWFADVTAEEIADHVAEIERREREAAHRQAQQEAWMMRTCDERAEIRAEWLAAQPKTLIPHSWADGMLDEMVYDMSRMAFGDQPKIKARCPKCNERQCVNAPDYVPRRSGVAYSSGTITIPVNMGK